MVLQKSYCWRSKTVNKDKEHRKAIFFSQSFSEKLKKSKISVTQSTCIAKAFTNCNVKEEPKTHLQSRQVHQKKSKQNETVREYKEGEYPTL